MGKAILSVMLRAVLFDVDFTIARPGPELHGGDGYRRLGERHGLVLDPSRYERAREAAILELKRHPDLDHDDELWVEFTERIISGMGGSGDGARACATEIVLSWERHENFDLYDDALPALADLRGRGLKLALVSNTARNLHEFVVHHGIDVDAVVSSRAHGKTKPHRSIFESALGLLDVEPAEAAMVGDSVEDDIEGARALGIRAVLLDRDGRHTDVVDRIESLAALPAALGLALA